LLPNSNHSEVLFRLEMWINKPYAASVLVGEHDRDDPLGHRRISRIRRVAGKGLVVIIDLKKDRGAVDVERAEVVLFVGSLASQKSSNTAIV
jgi:hypothetical protein